MLTVPVSRKDLGSLMARGDGPVFATFRYDVPRSALDYAKRKVSKRGCICLLPTVVGDADIVLKVFAAPGAAAHLARLAFEKAFPHHDGDVDDASALGRWFPNRVGAALEIQNDLEECIIVGRDPERRLQFMTTDGRCTGPRERSNRAQHSDRSLPVSLVEEAVTQLTLPS